MRAVADSLTFCLYATVDQNWMEDGKLAITSDRQGTLVWDGDTIEQGIFYNWNNRLLVHTLRSISQGTDTTLFKVVLTPLPIVCLNFADASDMGEEDSPCTFCIFSKNHPTEFAEEFTSSALARFRGSSSLKYPKKNFAITLIDEKGEGMDTEVMGIRNDNKLILNAMGADMSRMRNQLCFDIWNDVSTLPPSSAILRNGANGYFVEVLVNHRYVGLYTLSDKVNRKLLGLKKSCLEKKRGLLYKCAGDDGPTPRMRLPDDFSLPSGSSLFYAWELKYPDFTPDEECWQPLVDLLSFTFQADTAYNYVADHFTEHFYTANIADYVLFIMTLMVKDNCMHNCYLSVTDIEEDQRFWLTPWDLDTSFGRSGWADLTDYCSSPEEVMRKTSPFYHLFTTEGSLLLEHVLERWKRYRSTVYHPDSIRARINNYALLLQESGAWQWELATWQDSIIVPTGQILHLDSTSYVEATYMDDWYKRNYDLMDLSMMFVASIADRRPPYLHAPIQGKEYDILGRLFPVPSWSNIYISRGKKYMLRGKKK